MNLYRPNHHEIGNVRKTHARDFSEAQVDRAIERAMQDRHEWERGPKELVRVHDWREHVGLAVRREWSSMTFATRVAIALDAERTAAT